MTRRRPSEAPPPVHSDAAHRAITAELVRLTLSDRRGTRHGDRPELLVGWIGMRERVMQAMRILTGVGMTTAQAARQAHFLASIIQQREERA